MLKTMQLTAACAVLLTAASGQIRAGIIDTRPSTAFVNYVSSTGPDVAGGTFAADATNLATFTLEIGGSGSGTFQAIVLGTVAGTPGLPILWQSGDIALPNGTAEFVFSPNIALSDSALYFIGADFGSLTSATGADPARLGFVAAHSQNPLGTVWQTLNANSPPGSQAVNFDIASRIVMDSAAVPEPTTLAIWGIGALGCAVVGYRRRRAPGATAGLPRNAVC